ncbi:hypothetical protein HNQ69_001090 [Bartonella callosciuri]|uniref:EexN family lipoprotein n=1 Tax=Bartonella callosciuri TaxID=686223 RepID=A0A840P0Z2_9HYPH|nr:EexN family lipoprotein [Bartonella callosciuri]MBB5073957.1 hypothetical protein [Bartonella callosciuri]
MNKILITTLLLCTGLLVVGCQEKTYSVEDFKKDQKLLDEWRKKCESSDASVSSSQNCQNAQTAAHELTLEDSNKKLNESDEKAPEFKE